MSYNSQSTTFPFCCKIGKMVLCRKKKNLIYVHDFPCPIYISQQAYLFRIINFMRRSNINTQDICIQGIQGLIKEKNIKSLYFQTQQKTGQRNRSGDSGNLSFHLQSEVLLNVSLDLHSLTDHINLNFLHLIIIFNILCIYSGYPGQSQYFF